MTSEFNELEAFKKLMDERDRRYQEHFRAMDEKTSLALTGSDKALTKAEISTEKRFDAVNEFRGQLKDQAATLLPRAEADTKFSAIEEKIEEMKKEAHVQKQFDIRTLLSILALIASIAAILLRK